MIVNILTIAAGFYLALLAENISNILLQYLLEKRYRKRMVETQKLLEQVMLLAQPQSDGEDIPTPVN